MSYDSLFQRYGQPSREADIRITGYLIRPDRITEAKDIDWMNESASRLIAECESLAEKLKEYRQDIAARYSQLETMPYTERVELERYPSSTRGIQYFIRIVRRYEDGSEVNQLSETYDGKQRHIALKRFAEIQKQRPGIEAIKDIGRRSWER